jgi:hypothetical protein
MNAVLLGAISSCPWVPRYRASPRNLAILGASRINVSPIQSLVCLRAQLEQLPRTLTVYCTFLSG